MSLKTIWTSIKTWVSNTFVHIKQDADKVAITVTQAVKTMLDSGVVTAVVDFIDKELKTQIGEDVLKLLDTYIPKLLTAELALQGLPDNPSQADIQAFSDLIIKTFSGLDPSKKSKLYTTLAAQIYGIIETEVNSNKPLTFAEMVKIVDQAYQDYLQDIADEQDENADVDSRIP